ncbi:MAG: MiaB/RimO family radical SAM methylthiotransferase [Peptococcaceae bacterium]|jgi:tRNA-2-methylthio-N6-dimethylallyladenosine synthase|nr:MiaB/RimO family radical SAM methylthiotransferase [Peptococcaceae bacterium]
MQVFLATYGCQANERDSETILGLTAGMGYRETTVEADADLILLNTCSIRDKAEQKVFSYLGTLKQYKLANPNLIIGLCGCMAQGSDIIKLIRRRAPHVDFILGTHRLHRLPDMIRDARYSAGFIWDQEETEEIVEGLPTISRYPYKSLIHITFGCDNYCSYCVVPYVRGRERSRSMEDILNESRARVSQGAVEIMYLGQNVNAFGKKGAAENKDDHGTNNAPAKNDVVGEKNAAEKDGVATGRSAFAELLHRAQEIYGLERIRFMTSHPRDFSAELIQAVADCPKVARHVHLPVQSGSDRILRLMNRGYTREEYLTLTDRIRERIPGVTLTTDIIVGFPGETDEDFHDTLNLLDRVRFDSAFTFMYSPRKGTSAADMKEQMPLGEKKTRLQALMNVQAAHSLSLHRELVGQELKVLAENWDKGVLSGRGEGNQLIHFTGEKGELGRFHRVKVTEAQTWTLQGEITGHD